MHQCQEIHSDKTQLLCIFFVMRKKYYDHWQNQHDEFNTAKQDQSTVQQDSGNLIRFNSYSWCSFYCDAYEWFSSICSSSRSAAVMIYERWFSCSWSTYLTLVYKCYYSWWADVAAGESRISKSPSPSQGWNYDCSRLDHIEQASHSITFFVQWPQQCMCDKRE